jgi:hypothetical protein
MCNTWTATPRHPEPHEPLVGSQKMLLFGLFWFSAAFCLYPDVDSREHAESIVGGS